jgi:hypothetical protein
MARSPVASGQMGSAVSCASIGWLLALLAVAKGQSVVESEPPLIDRSAATGLFNARQPEKDA